MDNVKLEFAEDALRAVAKKAIERKTGARSLKGIIEDTMLDVMFDIPKTDEPRKVVITAACINDGETPKIEPLDAKGLLELKQLNVNKPNDDDDPDDEENTPA